MTSMTTTRPEVRAPLDAPAGLHHLDHHELPLAARVLMTGAGVQASRLEHLRLKPGVSLTARVVTDGDDPRWFCAFAPDAAPKADKTVQRARERGLDVRRIDLVAEGMQGHVVLTGPIAADKSLVKVLAGTDLVGHGGRLRGEVLSYNPLRRVVLRDESGDVIRLWAEPPASTAVLSALYAAGAPVLPAEQYGSHGVRQPWAPGRCLAEVEASDGRMRQVGAALARLHGTELDAAGSLPEIDPDAQLSSVRTGLAAVAAHLLDQFDAAADAVRAGLARDDAPTVLLHGDFSADQVVLPDDGAPVLIDLDRLSRGPAGYDVGSFAAVELLTGQRHPATELLRGMREVSAEVPTAHDVAAWTALHVLLRAIEPFRDLEPDWYDRIADRISLAHRLVEDDR